MQNSPVSKGMEAWRRMVTRWEPKVPSGFRGMLQEILFPKWGHPRIRRDTVVDGLGIASARLRTAAWRQDLGCNQAGSCVPPLARCLFARTLALELTSVRHMAAEIRTVAMARTTWSGPTPMDLSVLAKDAVCHVCRKKGHSAKDCW